MAQVKVLEGAVKTEKGVELNGFVLNAVVEKCTGCDRIRSFDDAQYCSSYPTPERKWSAGNCNFATHMKKEGSKAAKVNPLKASKRAAKGR